MSNCFFSPDHITTEREDRDGERSTVLQWNCADFSSTFHIYAMVSYLHVAHVYAS